MRAVIYARYSSDRQNDRSIEDQIAVCEALAAREGLQIVERFEDRALSGASVVGRIGLTRLLARVRQGDIQVVVAEALDRISRDQEDLAGLHKRLRFHGVAIVTVQDGTVGDIHVGVKGLLGSLYLKDLAQKTHRGQAGVVREGRHAGGRAFGYRTVQGRPGELAVDHDEAAVVRRIFELYAEGETARDIAATLNREGAPAPRGGVWNASAIAGSRQRENGILRNALYAGRIVWNRQAFVKDPDTGKRVSRPNPRSDWITTEAPDLRIVPESLWAAVQARLKPPGPPLARVPRPKHLLSGLLRCGCCGGSYTVSGTDRRGSRIECSRMKESGTCENRRSLSLNTIEGLVVESVRDQLLEPDLLAEYVRTYHEERRAISAREAGRRSSLEAEIADAAARIERIVKHLEDGVLDAAEAKGRLAELRRKRDEAAAALADQADPSVVTLHPAALDRYRELVGRLHAGLTTAEVSTRREAVEAFRSLVEKIVIVPNGARKPVEVEIHGTLGALLAISKHGPGYVGEVVAGTRNTSPHRRIPILIRVCSPSATKPGEQDVG